MAINPRSQYYHLVMRLILLAGAGSFVGGSLRYMLSLFIHSRSSSAFPFPTFVVNMIGCFAIGCLFVLSEKFHLSNEIRVALITGLIGGFTTFSAFSIEAVQLIRNGRIGTAVTYILLSVVVGLIMTVLGMWLSRYVATS